jgi:dihydrodipicolinate synthase/N-acetylneuraminate lyase
MTCFEGVFANLPTAFSADGDCFDAERMREHIDWLLDVGVDGVSCLLSAGEFAYQTDAERASVIEAVVSAVGGRRPILVGITSNCVRDRYRAIVEWPQVTPRS